MKGFTLFAVLCVFCISCAQEHDETGGEIDTYSYSDSSVNDTATNTSPVELDSSSETQEGIDTGKHRDTETTEDTQYRTPGGKDTTEEDTETTEGSGEEDSESIQDTGLPGQTDRDTGSDSESGTGEVDTVPEEESDTSLDTTPQDTEPDPDTETVDTTPEDTGSEDLGPCNPGPEFIPKFCCDCSTADKDRPECADYCAEEEPDTDTGPEPKCEEDAWACSEDGRNIIACNNAYDSETETWALDWVVKSECADFQSCYLDDNGWPECVRDQLGELGSCPDNIQGYEVCVRGYDVNWIKKCEHNQWRLKDTCEGRCIPLEDTWFPAFECE